MSFASPRRPLTATARRLYALAGIGILCGAAHCGSDAQSSVDDWTTGDAGIVEDGGLDASHDAGLAEASTGSDVDEARPDRDPSEGAPDDNRSSLDSVAVDRGTGDISGEPGVDGGSPDVGIASDGSPRDVAVAGDAATVDGLFPEADPPDDTTLRCNGYEALCDRRFDEVVFPTAHNAMSNADDGWIAPNQQHGIKRQLEDGIRAMLIDTYSYMGGTYLCHASCLLGNRPLSDALHDIAIFLQNNPHEVLALIIEDHASAAETDTAFNASGLADFVYVHPAGDPWPTLRTMIANGRRVLVGAESGSPPPGYYHHFYDLAWDTPYSFKSTSEFSCQQNRGSMQNALFLLNHWLENPLPDENLSRTANAHDVLLSRARQCQMESGKLPNFVAVSHYAAGDLFGVVRELNGL